MSLDVYLVIPTGGTFPDPGEHIYIREDGKTREISREEWNERHPDESPPITVVGEDNGELFWGNITHNLARMASYVNIIGVGSLYSILWRPDEQNLSTAGQLIPYLEEGLKYLEENPDYLKAFNPQNGWGSYEGLVEFVRDYLAACKKWPSAEIHISR
jgi:hypothetical protein